MTAETENLVLERLRGMRADTATLKDDVAGIRERLDGIDIQLDGWRDVIVAATGSRVTDTTNHETRIAALEGASA